MRTQTPSFFGKLAILGAVAALTACAGHPAAVGGPPSKPAVSRASAVQIARSYASEKYPALDFAPNPAAAEPPGPEEAGWRVHLEGLPKNPGQDSVRGGSRRVIVVVCPDGSVSNLGGMLGGW
ncbi:MAG: hypothetical protein PHQ12_07740 [Chthoniobacteraceae bacterium]|nr:hypothetical protein [Chthoniobacteraceae bacterium]